MKSNHPHRIICIILLIVSAIVAGAAEKRALLIGISDYPTVKGHPELEWSDIHGANDVVTIVPPRRMGTIRYFKR